MNSRRGGGPLASVGEGGGVMRFVDGIEATEKSELMTCSHSAAVSTTQQQGQRVVSVASAPNARRSE